jgi:hypothetical protein
MKMRVLVPNIRACFRTGARFGFLIAACLISVLGKAEISVRAEASETQVAPDQGVEYRVMVESDGSDSPPSATIVFPDLLKSQGVTLSGPAISSSQSIEIQNSTIKASKSTVYTYGLGFPKEGRYFLKDIQVRVQGKTYPMDPIEIQVDSKFQSQSQVPGFDPSWDPFGMFRKMFPRPRDDVWGRRMRPPVPNDLKLVLQASKKDFFWEGEPIWVKLIAYIHRSFQPTNIAPKFDLPIDSLFWKESLGLSRVKVLRTSADELLTPFLLDEFVLFALKPGSETLSAALSLDLADGLQTYPMKVQSDAVRVTVRRLPEPKPSLPLVSDALDIEFRVATAETSQDKPVDYQFVVSGLANLRLIKDLPLEGVDASDGSSVEVDMVGQEDQLTLQSQPTQFQLRKTGVLIFRKPGSVVLTVPPLRYFDPTRNTYHETDPIRASIQVHPSPKGSLASSPPPPASQASDSAPASEHSFSSHAPSGWPGVVLGALGGMFLLVILGLGVWLLVWVNQKSRQIQQASQGQASDQPQSDDGVGHGKVEAEWKACLANSRGDPYQILEFLNKKNFLKPGASPEAGSLLNQPGVQSLLLKYQQIKFGQGQKGFDEQDREALRELAEALVKAHLDQRTQG